jgi:hypothetical protein
MWHSGQAVSGAATIRAQATSLAGRRVTPAAARLLAAWSACAVETTAAAPWSARPVGERGMTRADRHRRACACR